MKNLAAALLVVSVATSAVNAERPGEAELAELNAGLAKMQMRVNELALSTNASRDDQALLADVAVYAKALEWMLRHDEFPKKGYGKQASAAIKSGLSRARELASGRPSWPSKVGTTIRGYRSAVDGSVQPYALTLPDGFQPDSGKRWPLHVKLHGRAAGMNEVNFFSRHQDKSPTDDQNWIQLDVYGRGNNAYRWAGETDVFEAIKDVTRRFRIDNDRITLHGFSMGGAGSWHLGLHHPGLWSSVGPGAGFVDFYKYQKQTEKRPPWQHATLGIYDAIDYSLNAANVPVCTYGGENDPQAEAGRSVVAKAKTLGVEIKSLTGVGMGHKFDADSWSEFMAFHKQKSAEGRVRNRGRRQIRFTTRTLKYNKCDWLRIEEVGQVYEPSTAEASLQDDGNVKISTTNIAVLSISRDAGNFVEIDGDFLPCYAAGEGLLPDVYYEKLNDGWVDLSYEESKVFEDNPNVNKRHDLQGPIDDAFMSPFVCVTGSQASHAEAHSEWVAWTLDRFQREFDLWMRGEVPVVADTDVDGDLIASKNLILFGDPSSNKFLAAILPKLPIEWNADSITVNGKTYSTTDHGLSMIYPNPLNSRKYIVINSGHTFHDKDFRASNSWLFARLGDIAIQKFTPTPDGGFDEVTVWAENFNSGWLLPANSATPRQGLGQSN